MPDWRFFSRYTGIHKWCNTNKYSTGLSNGPFAAMNSGVPNLPCFARNSQTEECEIPPEGIRNAMMTLSRCNPFRRAEPLLAYRNCNEAQFGPLTPAS